MKIIKTIFVVSIMLLAGCARGPAPTSYDFTGGEQDKSKLALIKGTHHKNGFPKMPERSGVCGVDGNDKWAYNELYLKPGTYRLCLRASTYDLNDFMSGIGDKEVVQKVEAGKTYFINFKNKFTSYEFWISESED